MTLLEFLVAMKWPLTLIVIMLILAVAASTSRRTAVAGGATPHECKTGDKAEA